MKKPTATPKRTRAVKIVRKAAGAPKIVRKAAGAPARKKTPSAAASAAARSRTAEKKVKVIRGGDNVFADLGFPNADEMLRKAGLLMPVTAGVQKLKMTQKETAELLGVSQPDVSRLMAGGFLHKYSVGRLIKMNAALGHDVDIIIRPPSRRRRRPGRIAVKTVT